MIQLAYPFNRVRAVDHCVEAMCALDAPPECDRDSSKGLKLLVPGLLKCKQNDQDLDARSSCQLGVIEAMKAGSKYLKGHKSNSKHVVAI